MGPNQKFPFNTRSFFTPEGRKAIGGGMELWRGYFQSIRPSENRMYLNIDIATGIMYRPGPLIGLFMEFFKKNDPSAFSPTRGFPDRDRIRLQKFVSNMRVKTTHTGRDRTVVIKKLSSTGASKTMFTMRDSPQPISVANYFRMHTNKNLNFPDNICVEVYLSFHLLSRFHLDFVVRLLLVHWSLSNYVKSCLVKSWESRSLQIWQPKLWNSRRWIRLNDFRVLGLALTFVKSLYYCYTFLMCSFQVLQYGQSEYVRAFGMAVTPTPISVPARVLPPPVLRYGPGSAEATIVSPFVVYYLGFWWWPFIKQKPYNGSWNMSVLYLHEDINKVLTTI